MTEEQTNVESTKQAHDDAYNVGYKEGYDKGFNEGYDKGYESAFRPGYDAGYDEGYRKGYDDAYERSSNDAFDFGLDLSYNVGYHRGFKSGYLDGASEIGTTAAEEAVTSLLPENRILPQYSARELILRGLRTCDDEGITLLSAAEVAARIQSALGNNEGLSIVRLGDGESLVLAQESVLDIPAVRERGPWLSRAGVETPDLDARDALKESVLRASIVGVPTSRLQNHQPLLFKAFTALQIDWKKLTLTHAVINYMLLKEGLLRASIGDRSVLLVGNVAQELQPVLERSGVKIAGAVGPVEGMRGVDRVMERVRTHTFDVAFVAAGIAAVVLAERIATEMKKVALDFGHLADELIHGQANW